MSNKDTEVDIASHGDGGAFQNDCVEEAKKHPFPLTPHFINY